MFLLASLSGLLLASGSCEFLQPIGGDGNTTVTKRVDRPKVSPLRMALGRTNWNTDFAVNQPYRSYKLFFTADSTDGQPGEYPIEAFLKFAGGGAMKVVDERMKPPTGTGAQFGPFSAPTGKGISQVNFKIGANNDPGGTGFSYRISVQGCN